MQQWPPNCATNETTLMPEMLFISHANPEDNVFTRWLALQLARAGYPVWCDLTQLLGGEAFWTDVEEALRQRTIKFLSVLSRTSNSKDGPLNELQVATNVARDEGFRDFIIPIAIDDLPSRQTHILLSRLNHVDFRQSWASGLSILLKLLEREGVKKSEHFGTTAVAEWWRNHAAVDKGVRDEVEEHVSNWFPAVDTPKQLYLHKIADWRSDKEESAVESKWPAYRFSEFLVAFASAEDFEPDFPITKTMPLNLKRLVAGELEKSPLTRQQARNIVTYLLRDGWRRMGEQRSFPSYELANQAVCHWFKSGFVPDDTIHFKGARGHSNSRQVVGYSTVSVTKEGIDRLRYWHFAFQARPYLYPFVGYALKPHVLFSDDAVTLWSDKNRMHRARRRNCRSWWNPRWRDLLLATASFLASEDRRIHIPLGATAEIIISPEPIHFQSPVTFDDPPKAADADELFETVEEPEEDDDESAD